MRIAADSRYARIMRVMEQAEARQPALRRIGDQLGAWYTPAALAVAGLAWWISGDAGRFLSVVVVATPCPLIIAIPVAIIGAISAAARRGVIVRNPAALEQLSLCRTMILDKTGTLTYGRPSLSDEHYGSEFSRATVLPMVAALERFSRHPLASALIHAAEAHRYVLPQVERVNESPGRGLRGCVAGRSVIVTGRKAVSSHPDLPPPAVTGLECIVLIDDRYAATYRFHDQPRADSRSFITHLEPRHGFTRIMIVSGDRAAEVARLAQSVAIGEIHASASPEEKVAIVRSETARAKTLFVGDGINDAPALASATVGIAFGQNSDVTTEAADVVVIDSSLSRLDELIHLSYRLRRVALESAVGGMALSAVGMAFAAAGALAPVAGAMLQEGIDLLAVLNALRTASAPGISDYGSRGDR
jgi:heavy metal translocating P-type ATPase